MIYEIFSNRNIKYVYTSKSLIHLNDKIVKLYKLTNLTGKNKYNVNIDGYLLIFGLYDIYDLKILYKFSKKGRVYILWGGSDCLYDESICNFFLKMRSKIDSYSHLYSGSDININIGGNKIDKRAYRRYIRYHNIIHLAISFDIENVMIKNNFNYERVFLTFCVGNPRYDILLNRNRIGIFVYDGIGNITSKKMKIYSHNVLNRIRYNKNHIVYRTSKNSFVNDIIGIYKYCFVSLRLTIYDGNANSAQECGLLRIPVIGNIDMNHCIPWYNNVDIEYKINYIYNNRIEIPFIWGRPKVLLVSGDRPFYGGSATGTYYLTNYLNNHGFDAYAIYKNEDNRNDDDIYSFYMGVDIDKNRHIILGNGKSYNYDGKYDFVILRTALSDNELNGIKSICKNYGVGRIIFFIPGIYLNDMSGYHMGNIRMINNNRIRSYTNSRLTSRVIKKSNMSLNNNIGVLHYNLLFSNRIWNNNVNNGCSSSSNVRDYDLAFIVSNADRYIKNVDFALKIMGDDRLYGRKLIFVGLIDENSNILVPDGIEYYGYMSGIDIVHLLSRTKILINTSYFDSFSNVVYEALENGCFPLVSENNGISEYMDERHIVRSYDLDDWIDSILYIFDNEEYGGDCINIKHNLDKIKWETEIRIQELLSKDIT